MVRCCPASGFGQLLPPYFRFGTILRNATQNGKSVDRRIANNFFFEVMANLIVRLVLGGLHSRFFDQVCRYPKEMYSGREISGELPARKKLLSRERVCFPFVSLSSPIPP